MCKSENLKEFESGTVEWTLNYYILEAVEALQRHYDRRTRDGKELLFAGEWEKLYPDYKWVSRMYKLIHDEEIPFVHPYMQLFARVGINDYEFVGIEEDRCA